MIDATKIANIVGKLRLQNNPKMYPVKIDGMIQNKVKSIDDKDTTTDNPIVAKAYIGNHLSLHITSTIAEVSGKKIIKMIETNGIMVVRKEHKTFIATKNDIKHIVRINVSFLLKLAILKTLYKKSFSKTTKTTWFL